MAKQKIEPGMQVRVARYDGGSDDPMGLNYDDDKGWPHGIKFGALCRVLAVNPRDNEATVVGPVIDNTWNSTQFVSLSLIKPAKQANKKA